MRVPATAFLAAAFLIPPARAQPPDLHVVPTSRDQPPPTQLVQLDAHSFITPDPAGAWEQVNANQWSWNDRRIVVGMR